MNAKVVRVLKNSAILVGGWIGGTMINIHLVKKVARYFDKLIKEDPKIREIARNSINDIMEKDKDLIVDMCVTGLKHYGYNVTWLDKGIKKEIVKKVLDCAPDIDYEDMANLTGWTCEEIMKIYETSDEEEKKEDDQNEKESE